MSSTAAAGRKRVLTRTLVTFLVPPALAAQAVSAIEAPDLVARVQEAYEALESYERVITTSTDMAVGEQSMKQSMTSTERAVPPGKYHSEMTLNGVTFLTVSDGTTTWVYNPLMRQYTEEEAATLDSAASLASMSITEGTLSSAAETATIVYEETLDVDGRSIACHVVHIDPSVVSNQQGATIEGVRMWLSESMPFIVKLETNVSGIQTPMGTAKGLVTNTLGAHTVNGEIADDVFTFQPPQGATKVEEFGAARRAPVSPLVGKPAPDFIGSTLAGEGVTLSSRKGKVVLIDFWATWCGPCRREMPHIQALHDAYGDDLEILAVSSEKLPTIQRYIEQKGYTFTTVHDTGRAITSLYGVRGLPTLVIVDAEGTVADYLVGLRSEEALRKALAGAGLEMN